MCTAEEGWTSPEEIPDKRIYDELNLQNELNWNEVCAELKKVFDGDQFLITGICGRWNGKFKGGRFITLYREFISCIGHLDKIKLYDIDGHFYIYGYHHDGEDNLRN